MFARQVENIFSFRWLDVDLDENVFWIDFGIDLEIIYFLQSFCFLVYSTRPQLFLSRQNFHHLVSRGLGCLCRKIIIEIALHLYRWSYQKRVIVSDVFTTILFGYSALKWSVLLWALSRFEVLWNDAHSIIGNYQHMWEIPRFEFGSSGIVRNLIRGCTFLLVCKKFVC